MTSRRVAPLDPLVERVESLAFLDSPGKALAKRIREVTKPAPLKEALSGTRLGHALHPVLTDVVIGSFLAATLLDVLGGDQDGRARSRLVGVGLAAAGPTALTGVSDWADSEPASDAVRRAGIVHAATNTAALSLYAASLAADRSTGGGALLRAGGATMLAISGYIGGHLSFRRGIGPNQTVFDPGPDAWTAVADVDQLPEGRPTRMVVDDTPVLMLREGNRLRAIHDRCSHRGCSLSELGEVDGDHVVCGCHGSTFDLRDGSIQRGPATAPQPAFEAREHDGRIELRLVASS